MTTNAHLFPAINETLAQLKPETITAQRRAVLQPLVAFIQEKVNRKEPINLNFICTHNSRRSHLSQLWAQTLAAYFHINQVHCYSAGTEATALFPMVAQTLTAQGFEVHTLANQANAVYAIKYGPNHSPVIAFSKDLNHPFNPREAFAAIMTCDSAMEACPFVAGAAVRLGVMFEDPKAFDNTPLQAAKYMERSVQIATELYEVFSQIKRHGN